MDYKEALEAWGAKRLTEAVISKSKFTITDVQVSIQVEEEYSYYGCSCCAPTEYSTPYIAISGVQKFASGRSKRVYSRIWQHDFDFTDFLREVCETAGGVISSK